MTIKRQVFLAIEEAVDMFLEDLDANPDRENSDKIMLMVTNSCSHRGDSSTLSIAETVSKLNSFVNHVKKFQLFYSIPTKDNVVKDQTTGKKVKAHLQYLRIIQGINHSVPQGDRGGILSYPFKSETLTGEFSDLVIGRVPVSKPGVCVIKEAKWVFKGQTIFDDQVNWNDSLEFFNSNFKELSVYSPSGLDAQRDTWQLQVERCCNDKEELASGCFTTTHQTIN